MTANLPGSGRPKPELLQITSSGLQTTIRESKKTRFAEDKSLSFDMGKYRLVPGLLSKNGTGYPDLVLYENAVALVDVSIEPEAGVVVTYLTGKTGKDKHVYRYTSAAAYMKRGQPAFTRWRVTEMETYLPRRRGDEQGVQGWRPVVSEDLDVQTRVSQQQRLAYEAGIQEGDLESPFLGQGDLISRSCRWYVDSSSRHRGYAQSTARAALYRALLQQGTINQEGR